jgi:hypothetical protein|tara:strand:+ start:5499 stop:5831 length:333 start_codon:yes stop_codon:yes gene_type:complete
MTEMKAFACDECLELISEDAIHELSCLVMDGNLHLKTIQFAKNQRPTNTRLIGRAKVDTRHFCNWDCCKAFLLKDMQAIEEELVGEEHSGTKKGVHEASPNTRTPTKGNK